MWVVSMLPPEAARYIVCGLLIDDGVKCPNHPTDPREGFKCRRTPDCRGHRHNIFYPKFGEVGVAVCDHPWPKYRSAFAMDFAGKVNRLGHRKEMKRINAAKKAAKKRHEQKLRQAIMYDEKEFTLSMINVSCSRCAGKGNVYVPEIELGDNIKCPRCKDCKGMGSFPGDIDKPVLRTEQHHESITQLEERLELPKHISIQKKVSGLLRDYIQNNPDVDKQRVAEMISKVVVNCSKQDKIRLNVRLVMIKTDSKYTTTSQRSSVSTWNW